MKKHGLIAFVAITILAIAGMASSDCFAGGWGGTGNYSTAKGVNKNGKTSTGFTHQILWLHYSYVGGPANMGQSVTLYPQYEDSNKQPTIDGECASSDVGFWVLARATDGSRSEPGKCISNNSNNKTNTAIAMAGRGGLLDDSTWFYRSESGCQPNSVPYFPIDNNGQTNYGSFYINQLGSGEKPWWSSFDTLSADNVDYGEIDYENTYGSSKYPLAKQQLFYNTQPIYENDRVATSFNDDIAKDYKIFTRAEKENKFPDLSDDVSGDAVWNQMRNYGVFAFCSYPENTSTQLKSKSHLELSQNGALKTSAESADWGLTTTNYSEVELDAGDDIVLQYYYDYHRTGNIDFATNEIFGGSSISVYRKSGEGYVSGSPNTPGFMSYVEMIPNQHWNYGHESEGGASVSISGLTPGQTYEYCATISHPATILLSSSGETSANGSDGSGACVRIRVKDTPPPAPETAEIDSNTAAFVGSTVYLSGTDTNNKVAEINVAATDAGPKEIKWAHYLGYKNRTDGGSGPIRVAATDITGNFSCSNVVDGVLPYGDPYNAYSAYNLRYLTNDGSCINPTNVGNESNANITKTGVFPGEVVEESQQIGHPSKVNVEDGSNAADSVNEVSGLKVRLAAENIQCGLDSITYGLDLKYPIGVNNAKDYRWLRIQRWGASNVSALVGDGLSSEADLWLKPSDSIAVSQVACFGRQIQYDAEEKGQDRWTKNPWLDDESSDKNSKFTLEVEDPISSTGVFEGISNEADWTSRGGASFWASEIGGYPSSPNSRIANQYRIETISNTKKLSEGTGQDEASVTGITTDAVFRNPDNVGATIHVKIPFNYNLELGIQGNGTENSVLSGDTTTFKAEIKNGNRTNHQVCRGVEGGSEASCEAYSTETKPTSDSMLVFAVDSEFKIDNLNAINGENGFFEPGDEDSIKEDELTKKIENKLGSYYKSKIKYAADSKQSIPSGNSRSITINGIDYSGYPVGTKICAAVAAFPADSHDMPDAKEIDNNDQSDAYWWKPGKYVKYNIACRTIAKYQTMSVEGNGAVAVGNMLSSQITYRGRAIRSWSEYQIVAGNSNASSGAMTAYHDASGTGIMVTENQGISFSRNDSKALLYPQSLGNNTEDHDSTYSGDEAKVNYEYAKTLRKNIIDAFGAKKGCSSGKVEGRKAYRICYGGDDQVPTPDSVGGTDYYDTIVIKSSNTITITGDSNLGDKSKWGNPKQIIIIANNINIQGGVERIDAWLIINDDNEGGLGGTLNTCAGHEIGGDGNEGNQKLLRECNKQLIINGPVIVGENGDGLRLLRTFGGGSRMDDEATNIVSDPASYSQRAEIFNFDPNVVQWAYNESRNDPKIVTTYTENLAPRL